MSTVHVAVPMLRGRSKFKLEKGRRWSVIEHLMLDAVADEPTSAAELSVKSKLPRRIVVEAFIRLMRVGWVEITPGADGPIFRATNSGLVQADAAEMRAATVLQYRWMAFSIDRVAGSVFRGREVLVRPRNKIDVPEGEPLIFLDPSERHSAEDIGEIYAALENEEEVILGTVSLPEPLFKGYAVFSVRDGVIDSLPGRARDGLKTAILQAAIEAGAAPAPTATGAIPATTSSPSKPERRTVEALFDHEDDLAKIYGTTDGGQVVIGRLAGAESIPVRIDLDRLVTRHSAVLGSTGSGKSTTVTSLLRSIAGETTKTASFPNARILLLDIHGEYATALKNIATVFRVNPIDGERPLFIPYWAIDTAELFAFLMGRLEDKAFTAILDKVLAAKVTLSAGNKFSGVDQNSLTADSPLPFSLKQLWFELIDPEVKTWADQARTTPAMETPGDAEKLLAPKYKPAGAGNTPPHINSFNVLSIQRQLGQMRSRLFDKQYDFMLHPGEWEPDLKGKTKKDLPDLLENWLGHDKAITILDLSGVPSSVLVRLIGGILNIIYEALVWGREMPEGGRKRPELIVMEEAHRYVGKETDNLARTMVQRIVKEGRKFGIGAMIVSQRPTEIDETILSQCGTFIALRLSNSADRSKVQAALPDSLSGLMDSLPVLRTGEAIIAGEAAKLPIRCRVTLPPDDARPSSEDPLVASAWAKPRQKENYDQVVAAWRAQNPRWKPKK